ncbi:PepSY-like domain-containing protein [Dysgonomonas sp. GY617]|uniref:PepSY-like domain-containing protein n=1 Tax=Dysgonomonas sp. GY617 TaxID=2780420 RepID=UPI0018846233|nr:PepSY-like domain-containing protein [Dysgonomonas sp. GY617]MBF0574801.1 PepSY-like domain-containing protein [Dysgonomonas sp. GY617]
MRKVFILLMMAVASFSIQAKDILPENVPAKVKSYVSKHYSKVNNIEWDDKSKKGYYEAEFRYQGREVELKIADNGTLIASKEDILIKDIPSFATDYIKKNYKDAQILGANKKYENGSTTYSVGVKFVNDRGHDRHRNIVFDSKGNLIKR